jgi:hypothetical protein
VADTNTTGPVWFSDRPGVRVVTVTALVFVPTATVKLLPPFDQAVILAQVAPRGGHAAASCFTPVIPARLFFSYLVSSS